MITLLFSRTVYYLVFRFTNFHLAETIDNDKLIFIYIEEIVFNLVIFYNVVLKADHQD